MKIIVGLGNPGEKYQNTRHNTGCLAVDFFVSDFGFRISDSQNNFNSLVLNAKIDNTKVILAKPQTFMNEAGTAVKKICDFYKVDVTKDLLVIHDDVDLPFDEIRTTASSSSAGHKGVQDIIDKLGTQDFHRIRIGIESRPPLLPPLVGVPQNSMSFGVNIKGGNKGGVPTDDFVLQNFSKKELAKLKTDIFPRVKVEIKKYLELGTWNLELANKKTA